MEPKREPGDDRTMWKIRPLRDYRESVPPSKLRVPDGAWAIMESGAEAIDMIEGGDLDSAYEIKQVVITAEEWNEMPEFEGW